MDPTLRKPYPSDLTDEQWALIQRFFPPVLKWCRPRKHAYREIVNAIFYIAKTGCQWRSLPHDFPPWGTVESYFSIWKRNGLWQRVHDALVVQTRVEVGRDPHPSAGVIDSQSVKTTEAAPSPETAEKRGDSLEASGYDAGKRVKGRKRHLLVDTEGLILGVRVSSASVQDREGAKTLPEPLKSRLPRLSHVWADGGYAGALIEGVKETLDGTLEIVSKAKGQRGFVALPRRWVVERTLAWLGKYRRLSKDYEATTTSGETIIQVAMTHRMLRRLRPARAP